jgi:integrase/recombinase XerD
MPKYYSKMHKIMEMRNFSPHTVSSYLSNMKRFAQYHDAPLESLTDNDVINYLLYLRKVKQVSPSTIHVAYSTIKFFYLSVLRKEIDFSNIPFPKQGKKLPVVLDPEEIKSLLDMTSTLKYKTIFMVAYSSGMRLSEIRHIRPQHIDSKRMQIHVQKGKGEKDRFTLLSKALLGQLRSYYKIYKPGYWLFPGKDISKPISSMAIQHTFYKSKKKPVSQRQLLSIPYATVLQPTF